MTSTRRRPLIPLLICAALTAAVAAAPTLQASAADNQASIAKKKKCKKKKKCGKKKKKGGGGSGPSGSDAALTPSPDGGPTFSTRPLSAGPQDRNFAFLNAGDQASGPVTATVSNGGPQVFTLVSNGCAGGVAGQATCLVTVRFTPQASGTAYGGMLTVTASPGGTASHTLTASTTVGG